MGGKLNKYRGGQFTLYTRVESSFWSDDKMRAVSSDARHLMLYLFTSPHRNILGFYFLPSPYACFDLGWDDKRFAKGLQELLQTRRVMYDEQSHVMLVCNYLKHNPLENPNQVKAAIEKLDALPETPLFTAFNDILRQFDKGYMEPLHKRLTERLPKPGTGTGTGTGTEYNVAPAGACELKNKKLSSATNEKNDVYSPEFEQFWSLYPRKVDKRKAWRNWKTRVKETDPGDIIAAANHYSHACVGKEQQFIKHASTFLGPDKPYEEWIRAPEKQSMPVPKAWNILKNYMDEEEAQNND